ncbi:MAG: histone-like protein [Fodinibius sp.]|nr:histone-like protein [Fodinibius sp.]
MTDKLRFISLHRNTVEQILKIHSQNKKVSEDVDLEEIARSTSGFSGADLENLLNEAALIAARYKRKAIEQQDIDQARDKVMMGLKREGIQALLTTRKNYWPITKPDMLLLQRYCLTLILSTR